MQCQRLINCPLAIIGRRTVFSQLVVSACLLSLVGCGAETKDSEPGTAKPSQTATPSGTQGDQAKSTTKTTPTAPEISEGKAPKSPEQSESTTVEVGDLLGVITYEGTVPELPPLVKQGDPQVKDGNVCATHDVPDESLQVNTNAGNGLANVFVYLYEAPKGAKFSVPDEPVVMDQKGCIFLPHAMVVRVGQTVLVKSDDAVSHNVHTFPLRNTGMNSIVSANNRVGLELIYDKAEPIPLQVRCDVHAWMRGYHLVLDHPFAAITDAEGKFEIKGLPVGTHKFRIWHERAKYLERSYEVELKTGETTDASLSFPAEKFDVTN